METKVIYIAHAYTELTPKEQNIAICKVSALANLLIEQGHIVFSPLSMYSLIDRCRKNLITHDQWMLNCVWWLSECSEMQVIYHTKNEKSSGIRTEREMAKKHGVEIIDITVELTHKGDENDTTTETCPAN